MNMEAIWNFLAVTWATMTPATPGEWLDTSLMAYVVWEIKSIKHRLGLVEKKKK
jgi:hypothetical protein